MAKTESTLKNMVLALLVITLVAGSTLGISYYFTKEPIELADVAKNELAIKKAVPGYDNNPVSEKVEMTSPEGYPIELFPCKKDGELIGVAVSTKTMKGFNGEVKLVVGFKPDGSIIDYYITDHKETPGLGTKMVDWFRPVEKTPSLLTKALRLINVDLEPPVKKDSNSSTTSNVLGINPGKANFTVSKDGGDIDAITAATISSRAFLDAIQRAYDSFAEYTKSNNN